jgi:hypothetical protein
MFGLLCVPSCFSLELTRLTLCRDQSAGYPASMGNDDIPSAVTAKTLLTDLMLTFRK